MDRDLPDGFKPLNTKSPFNHHVGPFFSYYRDEQLIVGLYVQSHHCNTAGILHGGMFGVIADVALGHNIGLALARDAGATPEELQDGAPGAPIVTVSLTTDFIGAAREGNWLETDVEVQRAGKAMVFANVNLLCGKNRIGRASAVFRILKR
ncbi:MAG: PaaI family thioesterase [Pseudomonadota bacterium]